MKTIMFSTKPYERPYFNPLLQTHRLEFTDSSLTVKHIETISEAEAVCCFIHDDLQAESLKKLHAQGVRLIALRSAGYDHVDLKTASQLGLIVTHVPGYSPASVAEFTVSLLLSLTRKLHKAYWRMRNHDFSLNHLTGYDLYQKTVGIIGTGRIGSHFANIMNGFGCHMLAYDPKPNTELKSKGIQYVELEMLYQKADIISLHCPLTKNNHHMINEAAFAQMARNPVIINTARGGLIDTQAAINALETQQISGLCFDVYENEKNLFYENRSHEILNDAEYTRLESFPNVLITGHYAYLTAEALTAIAQSINEVLSAYQNNALDTVQSYRLT